MTTSLPSTSSDTPLAHANGNTLGAFGALFAANRETAPRGGDAFARLLGSSVAPGAPTEIARTSAASLCAVPANASVAMLGGSTELVAVSPAVDVMPEDGAPDTPTRAEIEAALSLLAPVWQEMPVSPAVASPVSAGAARDENAGIRVLVTLPGREPFELDFAAPSASEPAAMPISAADALANTAASARKSEAAAVASVQIPPLPAPTAGAPALRATPAMVEVATLDDMTVTARVEPTASSEDAVSRERSFASAISAASTSANARALSPRDSATEKNSLTARESSVTVPPSEAGIGVAHASNVMTDTALPSPISAVAPAWRGEAMEAQVASSANAKDDVPSLAHRAVETVVAVVDAQAASRLQPTPGVSLRFRVGEEDLAVRIELRGGEVHTEFRTDSPDLRVALQHEWRALASRPDAAVRLSEPVFTNAGSGANHDSSSSLPFSQQHGQSTAQQQHQQQQHAALREAPEIFGRVGRRFSATTTEEAPAPVAPPASVSSRRLSAVA